MIIGILFDCAGGRQCWMQNLAYVAVLTVRVDVLVPVVRLNY